MADVGRRRRTFPCRFALLPLAFLVGCERGGGLIGPDGAPPPGPTFLPGVPGCEPEVLAHEPFWLEGDTVTLSFACGSGESVGDFEAELVAGRDGPVLDAGTWEVTWETGLDDGGRHDLMLTVHPAEQSPADVLPETTVATVWVADALGEPGNLPVVPEEYTEEWGLPVVHLQPYGQVVQSYVPATVTFLGRSYDAEIKLRGAVSLNYPKNSYTLRFPDGDLDASSVGLGNKDHLLLVTTFDDDSYVRQKLAYDLWAAIADFWDRPRLTPRTFFAVVYLDGAYHGLYMACDRIDDHFAQEMGLSSEGNIYKARNHDANFYTWAANGSPKGTLHQGYTKEQGEPEEGQEGAFADLEALVAFSASATDPAFMAEAADWIRVDEFMDWFLFVHYTASDDSGGKNCYLYNDPAQPEFRYVPWDFNHSFGQGWTTFRIGPDTNNDFTWTNGIFAHFQSDPAASAELWDRFHQMIDTGPLHPDWFAQQVDGYYALIDRSARRDWSVWGDDYLQYWLGDNALDYDQERAYLYDWLAQRDVWMRTYHP